MRRKTHQYEVVLAKKWYLERFSAILVSKMEVRKKLLCLIWVFKFHRSSYTPKNLESVLKGNSPGQNEGQVSTFTGEIATTLKLSENYPDVRKPMITGFFRHARGYLGGISGYLKKYPQKYKKRKWFKCYVDDINLNRWI